MASKLGISQKSYSKIENGATKLSEVMKCNISKILDICPSCICPVQDYCQIRLKEENKKLKELLTHHKIQF